MFLTCQYVAINGTLSTGVFIEDDVLTVVNVDKAGLVMPSPQQKGRDKIKAWLKLVGEPFPRGLTETREECCARTGLDLNRLYVSFREINNNAVREVTTLHRREVRKVVPAAAEEITRIMIHPSGHTDDPRVKAYLFLTNGRMVYLADTPEEFARRNNPPGQLAAGQRTCG